MSKKDPAREVFRENPGGLKIKKPRLFQERLKKWGALTKDLRRF
jgi:hypothetical protein